MTPFIPIIRFASGDLIGEISLHDITRNFSVSTTPLLHVEDMDADDAGAPQNIQLVHQLLSCTEIPIQFVGGIETMHTAELILGLGVRYVVLDRALRKSEKSPAYFFERLGEQAVAKVRDQIELELAVEHGAKRILFAPDTDAMVTVPKGINTFFQPPFPISRNLKAVLNVGFAGIIIEHTQVTKENQWKR